MADHNDIRFQAGQAAGQAQMKKDDVMDKATQSARVAKEQIGGILRQTGEHAKNMAQGAADAMKSAVGIEDNNSTNIGHSTGTTTTWTTTSKH